jgi:muramoyltetrapeptide carboxypeptidase
MPDVNGAILFLEDIYAGGHEVSEMLNHMELAGILDSISGIVFGEFCKLPERDCQDMTVEDVIVRKIRDKVPCIYGMNFSHGETVATIPLGVETIINAEECFVSFGNPF